MALISLRYKTVQLSLLIVAVLSVGIWYHIFGEQHQYVFFIKPVISYISTGNLRGMHPVRQDGLLEVNTAGRHPLLDLIEDAERRWDEMHAR